MTDFVPQWRSQGGAGGAYFFGVKNLKTLKVGSLCVSVNSELKIIESPTIEPPTIDPRRPKIEPPTVA